MIVLYVLAGIGALCVACSLFLIGLAVGAEIRRYRHHRNTRSHR